MKQLKIAKSFIGQLPNHEFPGLALEIIAKVQETELDEGQVKVVLSRLVNNSSNVGYVKEANRANPLTKEINAISADRKSILRSIRDVVNGKLLSPIAEERNAANTIAGWMQDYKGKIGYGGAKYQSNIVNGLSTTLKDSEQAQNALNSLNLYEQFELAQAKTEEILTLSNQRADKLAKNRAKIASIRKRVSTDLNLLISSIENEAKLELGTDSRFFIDLHNSLNEILANYRFRNKLRKANRKVSENNDDKLDNDIKSSNESA